jgi:hypothetical protein
MGGKADDCIRCKQGHCNGKLISHCVPKTCADQGTECGFSMDGCGNPLDCGTCPAGLTCAKGVCLAACK